MRTSLILLACLSVAACGESQVEVTEARQAKVGAAGAEAAVGEAPVELGDGLVLTVLARGSGEFVKSGGRVRVHYTADVVAVNEPEAEPEAEPTADDGAEEPEAEADRDATEGAEAEETPTAGDAADADAPQPATDEPAQDAEPEPAAAAFPRRFDSSRARGVPDDWDLSRTAKPRLIEGLRRGLVGLTAGSRVTLYVPAALAWGDAGLTAAGVPPNADVLYEIELLEVLP